MFDVFISYSSSDSELARRIALGLSEKGLRVWNDNASDPGGPQLFEQIKKAMHDSDVFVPIVSDNSISSQWLKAELAIAAENKKGILPIRFGATETPVELRHLSFLSGDQQYLDTTINIIAEEVEQYKSSYLKKRGLSRIWHKDAFSVIAGILGLIAGIASASLAFRDSLDQLLYLIRSIFHAYMSLPPTAYATVEATISIGSQQIDLKGAMFGFMFVALFLTLLWSLGALSLSSNQKTVDFAQDAAKTLLGFFVGAITGFLA